MHGKACPESLSLKKERCPSFLHGGIFSIHVFSKHISPEKQWIERERDRQKFGAVRNNNWKRIGGPSPSDHSDVHTLSLSLWEMAMIEWDHTNHTSNVCSSEKRYRLWFLKCSSENCDSLIFLNPILRIFVFDIIDLMLVLEFSNLWILIRNTSK